MKKLWIPGIRLNGQTFSNTNFHFFFLFIFLIVAKSIVVNATVYIVEDINNML